MLLVHYELIIFSCNSAAGEIADTSIEARVPLGETAILNCTAYGSPPPNISWTRIKDNTQLNDGDEGGRITVDVVEAGSFFKTSILGIGNLVNDDNGQYVCAALNDQGGDNETLSVYVLGKFLPLPKEFRNGMGLRNGHRLCVSVSLCVEQNVNLAVIRTHRPINIRLTCIFTVTTMN